MQTKIESEATPQLVTPRRPWEIPAIVMEHSLVVRAQDPFLGEADTNSDPFLGPLSSSGGV